MSKKKKIQNKTDKLVKSINNNIRSSVRKLNPILKGIVGKKVDVAIRDLEFSEKRITRGGLRIVFRFTRRARLKKETFHLGVDRLDQITGRRRYSSRSTAQ